MAIEVRMIALVAGNPLKAWRGSTGEDDTEHVPNDVWEEQAHPQESLADAKDFIKTLNEHLTTHVELWADGELLYEQDRGDDLTKAKPGYVQESQTPLPPDDSEVPEFPDPMPSQQKAK